MTDVQRIDVTDEAGDPQWWEFRLPFKNMGELMQVRTSMFKGRENGDGPPSDGDAFLMGAASITLAWSWDEPINLETVKARTLQEMLPCMRHINKVLGPLGAVDSVESETEPAGSEPPSP